MITVKDLEEAIAECKGAKNPNANTCIKLAAFYTILNNMRGDEPQTYAYQPPPMQFSDTEFSSVVESKGIDRAFPIMDDLMSTLSVLNPRLYKSVLAKLQDL